MKRIFNFEILVLLVIIILAFGLRFYKINIPLADHHSWRQADTAAVARNFAQYGFDFLHPQIDNLTPNNLNLLPNPNRYYLVEFPIYNAAVAVMYKVFGVAEIWARLVSILASIGSLILLYLITKKYLGKSAAAFTAFFFAVIPFNVFFSRTILPEPTMIFFSLGMMYFFIRYLEKESILLLGLTTVFSIAAFLVKPYALFLLLPQFILAWQKYQWGIVKKLPLYFYIVISLLPLILWRLYINQYPEGIPSSPWLFNEGNIRFKGAFFHWLIFDRMDRLIMTVGGFSLFILGIIQNPKKEGLFFYSWLIAIFIYFSVFASGNVTHDYYQIIFIPIAVIFMGKGASFLISAPREYLSRPISALILVIMILITVAFGWYEVKGFYNIQGRVDLAGLAVDKLTPQNSLIITGDTADPTLLYNTRRHGWAAGYATKYPNQPAIIEELKKQGAEFYVTTKVEELTDKNDTFGQYMKQNFPIITQTGDYVLFDLRKRL